MIKHTLRHWLFSASSARSRKRRAATSSPRRPRGYRPTLDALEDRRLLSVSTPGDESALVAADADAATVLGRYVFYNNSRFDGGHPDSNRADDGAIAVDKQALLPGQAATFANNTSFGSGINGLMVDVSGLAGVPTLADFVFRVGTGSNVQLWTNAPAPMALSVRPGDGVNGSTRITFTWPDATIKNEWLQVVVRSTANTGLAVPDVFYFGNAVGETGNSATNALVTAADQLLTRLHPAGRSNPAPVTSPYDFNRDGLVDSGDEIIARTAYNGQGGILRLLTVPTGDGSLVGPVASPQNLAEATAASVDLAPAYADFVKADVVGRFAYYNNSQFDAANPAANAADDAAIATDKVALLPGQSATLGNVTSYSRGLNGLIVDVAGLSGTPIADDFEFRVGTSSDPSTWTLAPRPLAVAVRPGAGVGGSARVSITWPDNVIENGWLQVTVKASPAMGLKHPDVFYFGNLVGDSGDNVSAPVVNAVDQIATRNSPFSMGNPAPITAAADYNRDSLVNASDEWIAATHTATPSIALIAAPAAEAILEPTLPTPDLVHWGDGGYFTAYAPTLVRTPDGTLLYFSEGRSGASNDATSYAVVMRRSFDNGVSWTPLTTVFSELVGTIDVGSPAAVVDEQSGEVFVLFTKDNSSVFVTSSADNGLTWSTPRDITAGIKVTPQGNPNPAAFPDTPWGWYAVGTGHGIQLQNGAFAGRLMIPSLHRLSAGLGGTSWSHVIYSDDHGQTWKLGGGLDQANSANDYANENTLVEGTDGSIYMSIRLNNREIRGSSRSFDSGMTWSTIETVPELQTSPVHASLLRVNENTVLFLAPYAIDIDGGRHGMRQAMTLWVSHDNMTTWTRTKTVFFGYASYSDMVLVGPDTVLLVFNGGRDGLDWVKHVYLARVNLRFLEGPQDYQFTWDFNEKAPGQLTELGGASILDSSPWDNRAIPLAASAAAAPQYVAGPDGHTALRLTSGQDRVQLTSSRTRALQFGADESFTVEATIRTTDSSGVIIGTRPGVAGWSLKLSNGFVQFTVDDQTFVSTVTSTVPVNDGNWHRIAVIRHAATRQLIVIIDGVHISGGHDATTSTLWSDDTITLGSYSNATGQLAFDIDVLRVSRRVLSPQERMQADSPEPPRNPALEYAAGAPNTILGLQFWLSGYDPTHFYADLNFADPLPSSPLGTTAVHSAIDASSNSHHLTVFHETRQVLYAGDPQVGPNWHYDAGGVDVGHPWIVNNTSGANPNNFDFVQNTGVFTISTFVKPGQTFGASMMLLDNTAGTVANNGFSLLINPDGSLGLYIVGQNSTLLVNNTSAPGLLSADVWYHVAVVGNGPGQPLKYYVTPVSGSTVTPFTMGPGMIAPSGPSPSVNNLYIGASANPYRNVFNGQMVDQAIYNRALSTAEIQILFDYTKKD
ncbi:MAG: LamG-like jellyroll fold domain-containing protein [Pirellulales bacterium]